MTPLNLLKVKVGTAYLRVCVAVAVAVQTEGMTPEGYRSMQLQLGEAQRKLVTCELELRAAVDKMEVYRRTEPQSATADGGRGAGVVGGLFASNGSSQGTVGVEGGAGSGVDEGKSEDDIRKELAQLREVLQMETSDTTKVRGQKWRLLDVTAASEVLLVFSIGWWIEVLANI